MIEQYSVKIHAVGNSKSIAIIKVKMKLVFAPALETAPNT